MHWYIALALDVTVNSNNAEPGPVAEGNISKTKPLSADAKEFYPKNYPSQQLEDSGSYISSLQFEEVRFLCTDLWTSEMNINIVASYVPSKAMFWAACAHWYVYKHG